jgi:decaprenyl-diphosphate synthase subunit 2
LKIAKDLLYSGKNHLQAWGLLVLLISKAAGQVGEAKEQEMFEGGGILQKQRIYAEITEIIKTGHMIHKGLINVRDAEYLDKQQNMIFGNKIALLTGDFLLAKANGMLSDLRNSHLSALISSALRDLTESEFVGERDSQNMPLPSRPTIDMSNQVYVDIEGDKSIRSLTANNRKYETLDTSDCIGIPHREWTMRNVLGGASLLGRGCEGALHLGGHDSEVQDLGYVFGCRVGLAWQASRELKVFSSGHRFSLVSAPVLFAMQDDPSLYEGLKYAKEVDYNALRVAVKSGPALEKTMSLYHEYSTAAVRTLDQFPNTDAANALRKIVLSMR